MKLYIKLDENGQIIGHDWNKENDVSFIKCKFNDPRSIFCTTKVGYCYKVINGEYIQLSENEFNNHPLKLKEKRLKKIYKLKTKIEKQRDKEDWKTIKESLTDKDEIKEVEEIISEIESEA